MAKQYYIPGLGEYTDGETGKNRYLPGVGELKERPVAAATFQPAWAIVTNVVIHAGGAIK